MYADGMDLRQLEIIRAIADSGSFTAAGEKLHVSQSAISRQILLLEDELGEPVFHRIGRRIRITPAGESLLQLSHRVFQDLHDTVSGISDKRESLRGTMRLVGGMTVCLYVFPALLAEVRRIHPSLDLKITVGSAERSIAMLRSGAGDLGLLTLPVEAGDLVSVPVLEEELLLITYPAHPLAQKQADHRRDLDKQPFILFETGSITRRLVEEFFTREHIEAADRDGNGERRDHQGDGAPRTRHQHHPVAGRGRRRPDEAAVLQPDCRTLADAADRMAVSEDEPSAADGHRGAPDLRYGAAAPRCRGAAARCRSQRPDCLLAAGQRPQRVGGAMVDLEPVAHFDLDLAVALERIRIARIEAKQVVVARLRVDALDALVEVVLVDDGKAAGLFGEHAQGRLRLPDVVLEVLRVDLLGRCPARRSGRADRSCRTPRWRDCAARVSVVSSATRSASFSVAWLSWVIWNGS